MKMQEVIRKLRMFAPVAEKNVRAACEAFENLRVMLQDASHTSSTESLRVLQAACLDKADTISKDLCYARESVDNLATVNREYKEKLGPRGPKKPKDAEGQQMLPGLEDLGGTPTTTGDMSTTGGGTPSFMQSGRHG